MKRTRYTQPMIDGLIAAGGLAGNDFHEADLSNADLHRADLKGINWGIDPDTIRVENLCAKILASIDSGAATLDMARWHCGTAHCLAGHAIVLAPGGREAEISTTPGLVGAAIFAVSCGEVPNCYGTKDGALAWLRGRV